MTRRYNIFQKLAEMAQVISRVWKALETIAKLESALHINLWGSSYMVDGYQPVQPTKQYLSDIDPLQYNEDQK